MYEGNERERRVGRDKGRMKREDMKAMVYDGVGRLYIWVPGGTRTYETPRKKLVGKESEGPTRIRYGVRKCFRSCRISHLFPTPDIYALFAVTFLNLSCLLLILVRALLMSEWWFVLFSSGAGLEWFEGRLKGGT